MFNCLCVCPVIGSAGAVGSVQSHAASRLVLVTRLAGLVVTSRMTSAAAVGMILNIVRSAAAHLSLPWKAILVVGSMVALSEDAVLKIPKSCVISEHLKRRADGAGKVILVIKGTFVSAVMKFRNYVCQVFR